MRSAGLRGGEAPGALCRGQQGSCQEAEETGESLKTWMKNVVRWHQNLLHTTQKKLSFKNTWHFYAIEMNPARGNCRDNQLPWSGRLIMYCEFLSRQVTTTSMPCESRAFFLQYVQSTSESPGILNSQTLGNVEAMGEQCPNLFPQKTDILLALLFFPMCLQIFFNIFFDVRK